MSLSSNAANDSFNRHGPAFWDERGPYRTLHRINPARMAFIRRFIDPRGHRILDVGCGGGALSEALAKSGAVVSGIDLSPGMLAAAREHLQGQTLPIDYREMSTRACLENGERYDHVTCMEVLEHVSDPASVLRDIHDLLTPGGYAFFSTLNRSKTAFLLAIVAAERVTGLVPKGTHDYNAFIRPDELVNMAEQAGLEAVALSGMDYLPLLRTAVLGRKLKVNYLLATRRPAESP